MDISSSAGSLLDGSVENGKLLLRETSHSCLHLVVALAVQCMKESHKL